MSMEAIIITISLLLTILIIGILYWAAGNEQTNQDNDLDDTSWNDWGYRTTDYRRHPGYALLKSRRDAQAKEKVEKRKR